MAATWKDLNEEVLALYERGDYKKALEVVEIALDLANKAGEEDGIFSSLNNKGAILDSLGRGEEAKKVYLDLIDRKIEILGEDDPSVAVTLNNVSFLLAEGDNIELAERKLNQALRIWKSNFGPNSEEYASGLHNLASLKIRKGNLHEAEALLNRSLSIYDNISGLESPHVADTLNNLAIVQAKTNRIHEAKATFERALDVLNEEYGIMHPQVGLTMANIANLNRDIGNANAAKEYFERAIDILESTVGPDHPSTIKLKDKYHNLAGGGVAVA